MTHSYHLSDPVNLAEKPRPEAQKLGLFVAQKSLSGEELEAKKRMFNLPNRNLVENKGTLEEQTGTKLKI